jgi:hypothetical protein
MRDNTFAIKFIKFIFSFIFGSVFSFGPMTMLYMTLSQTGILRINCDRIDPQQVNCQISRSKFFDLVQQESLNYELVNSVKYNVIKSKDSDGDTVHSYNLSLLTEFGEKVPFEEGLFTSTVTSIVSELNSFLQSKQKSFRYTLDERFVEANRYFVFLLVLPFIIIGWGIIYVAFLEFRQSIRNKGRAFR